MKKKQPRHEGNINNDASWCKQSRATGIGMVARDNEGNIVRGMKRKLWRRPRQYTTDFFCRLKKIEESKDWIGLTSSDTSNRRWSDSMETTSNRMKHHGTGEPNRACARECHSAVTNKCTNLISKQARLGVCLNDWVSRPDSYLFFYYQVIVMLNHRDLISWHFILSNKPYLWPKNIHNSIIYPI